MTRFAEMQAGSNYVSQQPLELHFGLGDAAIIDQLRVEWPDGLVETFENVAVNQFLVLIEGGAAEIPALDRAGLLLLALLLSVFGLRRARAALDVRPGGGSRRR